MVGFAAFLRFEFFWFGLWLYCGFIYVGFNGVCWLWLVFIYFVSGCLLGCLLGFAGLTFAVAGLLGLLTADVVGFGVRFWVLLFAVCFVGLFSF